MADIRKLRDHDSREASGTTPILLAEVTDACSLARYSPVALQLAKHYKGRVLLSLCHQFLSMILLRANGCRRAKDRNCDPQGKRSRGKQAGIGRLCLFHRFTSSSIFPESPGLVGSMWHHLLCPTRASAPASVISARPAPVNKL